MTDETRVFLDHCEHESFLGRAARFDISEREHQVLTLMADGLSNCEIADKLDVQAETIKTHVANIMRKLKAKNRTAAGIIALRNRIIK